MSADAAPTRTLPHQQRWVDNYQCDERKPDDVAQQPPLVGRLNWAFSPGHLASSKVNNIVSGRARARVGPLTKIRHHEEVVCNRNGPCGLELNSAPLQRFRGGLLRILSVTES
eukprot:3608473-Rhodomonas_salina.2